MKRMKVAVIGCGTIAKSAHFPSFSKNPLAEIKYACDIDIEKAEEVAKQYTIPRVTADYRDILRDPEVEAVSICTPNDVHAPMTIDFLRAGKNVLCEKPSALNATLAKEMQKAADEAGKILNIGVVNRFNTAVNLVKEMIEKGELGEVYHIYCSFRSHRSIPGLGGQFTTKAKSGGGVLIDWGVHFLDLILYVIGQPRIHTVTGQTYSKLAKDMKNYAYINMWAGPPDYSGMYDVEEFVTGMIRTEGPTITLNGAWAQNIGEDAMFIEFLGDKAGIKLQYSGDIKVYSSREGVLIETVPSFKKADAYYEEIDAFIKAARKNEKIRSNIDNIIITSEIMDAIYRSSEMGKEVAL